MAFRDRAPDNTVEVVVDPDFPGDVIALAARRPVWIVESEHNRPIIDAAWQLGRETAMFEVSRCVLKDPKERESNLFEILGSLDDHLGRYDFVAHGLEASAPLRERLEKEGFRIDRVLSDGFSAIRIPGVREKLIGWLPEDSD
jgi:hypothetical protein